MNDVTELMALFMSQYQTKQFADDGGQEKTTPAPLDELDTTFGADKNAKLAARAGIEHFVAFCRKWLQEHPPETHIMLAQGFGVRLRGGYDVSLTPPEYTDLSGQLEQSPAYPVTIGHSHPSMRGLEPSVSYPVTGAQPHPGLRGPGA